MERKESQDSKWMVRSELSMASFLYSQEKHAIGKAWISAEKEFQFTERLVRVSFIAAHKQKNHKVWYRLGNSAGLF